jgi:hypothetical protein
VELGEVEAILLQNEIVKDCVVFERNGFLTGISKIHLLVTFIKIT